MKLFLNVDVSKEAEVKKIGAEYDEVIEKWHVPGGIEIGEFMPFLDLDFSGGNLLSIGDLFIIEAEQRCWKCGKEVVVTAVGVDGYVSAEDGDYENPLYLDEMVPLSYVKDMPQCLLSLVQKVNPLYRFGKTNAYPEEYFINYCPCGAAFGDFFLFGEPGEAFWPTVEEEAPKRIIQLATDQYYSFTAGTGNGAISVFQDNSEKAYVDDPFGRNVII